MASKRAVDEANIVIRVSGLADGKWEASILKGNITATPHLKIILGCEVAVEQMKND